MMRLFLVAIASKPIVVVPFDREALPTSTDRAVGIPKLVANDLTVIGVSCGSFHADEAIEQRLRVRSFANSHRSIPRRETFRSGSQICDGFHRGVAQGARAARFQLAGTLIHRKLEA